MGSYESCCGWLGCREDEARRDFARDMGATAVMLIQHGAVVVQVAGDRPAKRVHKADMAQFVGMVMEAARR